MAVKSSVMAFAKRAASELYRIDAVLLNAGIDTNVFELAEGNESTVTVDVVSTSLLAVAVLPKLRETASRHSVQPRLAVLGSSIHIFAPDGQLTGAPEGKIFATLNDGHTAAMASRYFLSKLMVSLCLRELAGQVDSRDIVVNCVNPG